MVQRLLYGSLALAPATILVHYLAHPGGTSDFTLAAAALVPLAWLIGEATEHAAQHTGPGIGGFLNATFGNAPELIIALFAVSDGLFEVVRGSLTGSVIGNLLLVLGFSLAFGGRGELDRPSTFTSLGLVAAAVLLFLVPSIPAFGSKHPDKHFYAQLSIGPALLLLLAYLVVTYLSLRRHRALHAAQEREDTHAWSLPAALAVLAVATAATAIVAEILVGSIEDFAAGTGLSDFFIAAVIIAIVGNAAEHGGAVVVAARGQIKLAAEIALASSAQVAVFLVPAVALLAWAIHPLALSFRPVEIGVLAGAVLLTSAVVADGRSSRARGLLLIGAYLVAAGAFFAAGDR
jgi:Ca2+:H+ antiporter